jgi:beta-lactam-binding protein with PASTA domain
MQRWYSFLTVVPFCLFVVGYMGGYLFVQRQEFVVPDLIGKNIQEAAGILAPVQMGITLFEEKEDNRVAEGVVLHQIPSPGTLARAYRNVLVTLSKRSQAIRAPRCVGKSVEEVENACKQCYLTPKIYFIQSKNPQNSCIAQYPEPESPVSGSEIVVYCSAGQDQLYVFPDFTTILRSDAEQFLKKLPVEIDFFGDEAMHGSDRESVARVIEQNPLAGTIFDSSQFLYVQFRIQ